MDGSFSLVFGKYFSDMNLMEFSECLCVLTSGSTYNVGSLNGRDHSKDMDVDERIILKRIIGEEGGRVWTGFMYLWIMIDDGLLQIR
jgi:hypothetical protein